MIKNSFSRKDFMSYLFTFFGSLFMFDNFIMKAFAGNRTLEPRKKKRHVKTVHDLVAVSGNDAGAITRKAIDTLGGMNKFVKKGDVVVVKPNIGWDREPQFAANTNPDVVYAIVKMCYEAGAKEVKVFDNTCNDARMCYKNSGIYYAAKRAGAQVSYIADWKFYKGNFPSGSSMEGWPIYRDAVECDVFINVPVIKHHSLTGLTLSIKNLMGVCGSRRGKMHWGIDKKLAELAGFIKPDLTIIDAYRVLLRHGPRGGDLKDVKLMKTICASADPVLADAYAARLMSISPNEIGYIKKSAEVKLGSMDLGRARIRKLKI